jgi:hypothetical protein
MPTIEAVITNDYDMDEVHDALRHRFHNDASFGIVQDDNAIVECYRAYGSATVYYNLDAILAQYREDVYEDSDED